MQGAIDRIMNGDSGFGSRFLGQVSPSVHRSAAPVDLSGAIPVQGTCSIPLLEMRVNHAEQFTIRIAPPSVSVDPMPQAQPPAPACQSSADSAQRR